MGRMERLYELANQYARDARSRALSDLSRAHVAFDAAYCCFLAAVPDATARRFEDIPDAALAELGASSLGLSNDDVELARRLAAERYGTTASIPQAQVLAWSDRVLARMQNRLAGAPQHSDVKE